MQRSVYPLFFFYEFIRRLKGSNCVKKEVNRLKYSSLNGKLCIRVFFLFVCELKVPSVHQWIVFVMCAMCYFLNLFLNIHLALWIETRRVVCSIFFSISTIVQAFNDAHMIFFIKQTTCLLFSI